MDVGGALTPELVGGGGAYAAGPSGVGLQRISIGQALRATAARYPDIRALAEGVPGGQIGRSWTYQELLDVGESGARALLAIAAPAQKVAIWANNVPEWYLVQMSAALANITLVTVNPALRADEAAYILAQSGAVGVIHVREYRGYDVAGCVDRLKGALDSLTWSLPIEGWSEFVRSGSGSGSAGSELPEASPGAIAQIQYTSGTTGLPKGAMLRHYSLLNNARLAWAQPLPFGPGVAMVNPMPLFHTAGSVLMVLSCLQAGSTLVLVPDFNPGLHLELVASQRCPVLVGVPTMLRAMLADPARADLDLSCLEVAACGGAFVEPDLVHQVADVFGVPLLTIYAQTEASPGITMTSLRDTAEDRTTTVGRALPEVEIQIVRAGGPERARFGEIGEICTRGYHVMAGYHDDPEQTAAAIDPNGWLHTGDLAVMDERGYVRITGRLKEMIIRGGENIYPTEIEAALATHPSVVESAVIGRPDTYWGEEVCAVVRLVPGSAADEDELTTFLRARLARHKVPRHWRFVEAFPLTASGKIVKRLLREIPEDPVDKEGCS